MNSEDRAGLYITVIFHLLVIIVLLACQIGAVLRRDNTFVLDFTKQEEVEKQKAEENFKEEVSDKLDELLAAAAGVPIRNIAVDRSSTLKDDRNTDAEQLYKESGKSEYREMADKILRALLDHQLENGGFVIKKTFPKGSGRCSESTGTEAYWCCTMRGGAGLAWLSLSRLGML